MQNLIWFDPGLSTNLFSTNKTYLHLKKECFEHVCYNINGIMFHRCQVCELLHNCKCNKIINYQQTLEIVLDLYLILKMWIDNLTTTLGLLMFTFRLSSEIDKD